MRKITLSRRWAAAAVVAAVAALSVGVSAAAASDVSGVITSVTKTTTQDQYALHKRVSLTMSWSAGVFDLKAGDTMSLTLDSSLGCDATPNMLAPDGATVATGSCSAGVVTWTFTSWVVSHPLNRHGGAVFTVETLAADDEVTVTWDGSQVVLPVVIVTPGGGRGYAKWALDDHWRIRFGYPLKAGTITFTENLGECQTLDHVVWVKGSGTFDPATGAGTTTWDGDGRHTPILDIYVKTTCLPQDSTYRNGVVANGKSRFATAEAGSGAWGTGTTTTTTTTSSTTSTTSSTTTSPSTSTTSSTTSPSTTTSSTTSSTGTSSRTTAPSTTTPAPTSSSTTTTAPLPHTGSNVETALPWSLGALIIGGALLIGSRPGRRGRYQGGAE